MIDKKTSNLKLVLVIILLFIIGFAFYFLVANKTPTTKSSVSTSTATSSIWAIYKNSDLGFQVIYPTSTVINTTNKDEVVFNDDEVNGNFGMWLIDIRITTPEQTMDEILKQYNSNDIFEKKFTIDGFDAYEYGIPEEKNGPVYTYTVLVMNGKKLYEINVKEGQHNDQIINSFHFLK